MKGVSPLVASVLLIVLVVSAASLVTTWMSTLVKSTQETVGVRTMEGVECTNADITIDEVYVSNTGAASVVVKNSGFVNDMSLVSALTFDKSGNSASAENVPLTSINKGDLKILIFNDPSINCASFSQVIVTTNCAGVSETFSGTPQCV